MEEKKRAYSVEEAAQVLGVNPMTLYKAIKRGEISVRYIGRRIIVPLTSIDKLLAE